MGWFRVSHDPAVSNRFFRTKVLLFAIGAGFGLAGMASEHDYLVAIGIVFLAAGIVLRILGRRSSSSAEDDGSSQ